MCLEKKMLKYHNFWGSRWFLDCGGRVPRPPRFRRPCWPVLLLTPLYPTYQTCAKVSKRYEILGSLSPRSGTLMDLRHCTSFLSWDSGNSGHCDLPQDPGNPVPRDFDMQRDSENPGPQHFDGRKTLKTQDLKIWISGETQETQNPEPQNFDVSRL